MRMKREWLLAPDQEVNGGIYHCVSRVVWREFIFGGEEKEYFRKVIRKFEKYCGVEVMSYCLMSNHFHILVRVPPRPSEVMGDEEFLKRLGLIYSKVKVGEIGRQLQMLREGSEEGLAEGEVREDIEKLVVEFKEQFTRRMWDLSEFMKAIKQKFTLWYNKRSGKRGTLWEGRFKSVLVQGGRAARMTAAYIDLNPVRAGIVEDAKDYRWSSYGEAVAGGKMAQNGLRSVYEQRDTEYHDAKRVRKTWVEVMVEYRMLLAEEGVEYDQEAAPAQGESMAERKKKSKGYSRKEVEKILKNKGELSWTQLLRCKTRYFTDGVVLGSKDFVESYFTSLKEREEESVAKGAESRYRKRETGARKMKGVSGATIYALRDLRQKVISLKQ